MCTNGTVMHETVQSKSQREKPFSDMSWRLSLQCRGKDKKYHAVPLHLSPMNYDLAGSRIIRHRRGGGGVGHSAYPPPMARLRRMHWAHNVAHWTSTQKPPLYCMQDSGGKQKTL